MPAGNRPARNGGKRRAAGSFSVSGEAGCQVLYARAATYLRPRAVPTVHARASAAALSAPPRASARTSGVVESKRQAEVAAVMVAIVPESVEPWEPSKGRIVRCFHCVGHRVDGRGTRCQREQREENKRTPQEHADLEDAHGLRAPFLHAERACDGRNVSWRARVTGRLGSSRAESKQVGKGAAHRLRAGVAASRAPRGPRLRPTDAF